MTKNAPLIAIILLGIMALALFIASIFMNSDYLRDVFLRKPLPSSDTEKTDTAIKTPEEQQLTSRSLLAEQQHKTPQQNPPKASQETSQTSTIQLTSPKTPAAGTQEPPTKIIRGLQTKAEIASQYLLMSDDDYQDIHKKLILLLKKTQTFKSSSKEYAGKLYNTPPQNPTPPQTQRLVSDTSIAIVFELSEDFLRLGKTQTSRQQQGKQGLMDLQATINTAKSKHETLSNWSLWVLDEEELKPIAVGKYIATTLRDAYHVQAQRWEAINLSQQRLYNAMQALFDKEQALLQACLVSSPALKEAAYAMQMQEQPVFSVSLMQLLQAMQTLFNEFIAQHQAASALQQANQGYLLQMSRALHSTPKAPATVSPVKIPASLLQPRTDLLQPLKQQPSLFNGERG